MGNITFILILGLVFGWQIAWADEMLPEEPGGFKIEQAEKTEKKPVATQKTGKKTVETFEEIKTSLDLLQQRVEDLERSNRFQDEKIRYLDRTVDDFKRRRNP